METEQVKHDITKWIEWAMIGEKSTSYKNPIVVTEIKDYNGFVVLYAKNFDKCLAIDRNSFITSIKQYQENTNG